jgi:DNA-binding IclR family transcriptional regulator
MVVLLLEKSTRVLMDIARDGANKHTIPVIDKMMEVLASLERQPGGASIRTLTAELGVPRTTVYRILNTLQQHDMVWRDEQGSYRLGRRLLSLAAHVASRSSGIDLAALAQPHLDRLALELGEGVKLSVLDEQGVLVLAAAQGRRDYALTVAPGQRMPAHAGAASKVLLAHLPADELGLLLAQPLAAYTAKTLTDPKRLRAELARIKRVGWAQDRGENGPSIQAFAAPVFSRGGELQAALSVPYLAGAEASRMEEIRLATIAAARAISDSMPV